MYICMYVYIYIYMDVCVYIIMQGHLRQRLGGARVGLLGLETYPVTCNIYIYIYIYTHIHIYIYIYIVYELEIFRQ